jgi:hypothetical protein
MTRTLRRFRALHLVAALLCLAGASSALEPDNADYPWKSNISFEGDVTLYSTTQNYRWTWWWFEEVTASDTDYIFLGCHGRTLETAGIEFRNATGDLDIEVFDLAGNYLGASRGVGDRETVDVRTHNEQVVVVKVYGFNGATGSYSPQTDCN